LYDAYSGFVDFFSDHTKTYKKSRFVKGPNCVYTEFSYIDSNGKKILLPLEDYLDIYIHKDDLPDVFYPINDNENNNYYSCHNRKWVRIDRVEEF
jgi:hypothetical protein